MNMWPRAISDPPASTVHGFFESIAYMAGTHSSPASASSYHRTRGKMRQTDSEQKRNFERTTVTVKARNFANREPSFGSKLPRKEANEWLRHEADQCKPMIQRWLLLSIRSKESRRMHRPIRSMDAARILQQPFRASSTPPWRPSTRIGIPRAAISCVPRHSFA